MAVQSEISKLEQKYASINQLNTVERELEKQISRFDSNHSKLGKEINNIQQRLVQVDDSMKLKLETSDLTPIREAMQLLATKKQLEEQARVIDENEKEFANIIEQFRQETENQTQILLRYDQVLAEKASKSAWLMYKVEIATKCKMMKESADLAIKRAENIEGSNLQILSLKDDILAQVEEMLLK